MLSDQEVWLSMLSTVSVISGKIFAAEEAKLNSIFVMTIFKKQIQFKIGDEYTCRSMVSASRNVSRYYNLPGRETV